jgi:hypothetical protein
MFDSERHHFLPGKVSKEDSNQPEELEQPEVLKCGSAPSLLCEQVSRLESVELFPTKVPTPEYSMLYNDILVPSSLS